MYSRLAQSVEAGSTLESVNLGGIDVTHLSAPNNQIPHVWTWAVDDVMLGIQAADEETATRLIALLPTTVPAPEPAASGSAAPMPSAPPQQRPRAGSQRQHRSLTPPPRATSAVRQLPDPPLDEASFWSRGHVLQGDPVRLERVRRP